MNAIEMKNVNKTLGDFAIQNLDFVLPEGCICGLVGENGAGKSTTIRLIMGALKADSGEISVLGTDVYSSEFIGTKQDIGVVLDDAFFPEVLNASQIRRIMRNTYVNWNDALFDSYIRDFSLPVTKPIKDYSRGMRMKLAIASALCHDAKLLVLDEATAGLDPIVRDEVLDMLNEFTRQEDHSILISSHIISDLEKLCDYIAFIHEGKLKFCEEKDALIEKYGIFAGTNAEFRTIDSGAVIYSESNGLGGVRAMVLREKISEGIQLEKCCIEDVILNTVKGEKKR